MEFIDQRYKENPLSKFFLLNLPVGSGKSHLAIMITDWYRKNVNRTAKIDVITNSKLLQDQYSDTYDSISDLKGKDNYDCKNYSCSCAQGSEFNRLNKTKCDDCPYTYAREGFMSGGISLTNFYLYILYSMYNQKLMESRGAKVLIVDECLHPSTLITMSDGTKKRIDCVSIGDSLLTINESTKKIEEKKVKKLHKNLNKGTQMYEVVMENGDLLKITGNHKVKLINGDWKKVEDLNRSDEILYIKETESHDFDNNGDR